MNLSGCDGGGKKMNLSNNILKYYLKNCYFINGTAYAGKSTMCAMLAERYHLVHCEENYHLDTILSIANPENQPNISYVNTKPSWEHFVNRTPDEYEAWVDGNNLELAEFEEAELIRLSPQSMSVERFFEREDEEKQFLLSVIRSCPDPEKTMDNFKQCIARVNSPERYEAFRNSGFYTLIRQNNMAEFLSRLFIEM